MAKKRRLSKRDRKIRLIARASKKWALLLKDDDFLSRLFVSIKDVDPTFSGYILPGYKTLRYYISNGEEIVASYDIAVLTDEGAFIYSRPYSDDEIPF